jgi:hypothetical protein
MKVEDLTITLRNRSNWEAIDLGFALGRQWFFRLWGAWIIAALPVFILVMALTYFVNNEIFNSLIFILFWWLKPLYEQPLLYILSRQLFSEPVTLEKIKNNYIQIIKPQLSALLLWRRFSFSRSFNNPVAMLENINGKPRRERLNVLHSQQSSASQWLTIICLHLELLLYLAFLFFIFALVPSELYNNFDFFELFDEENILFISITNITYFIAISIIAPFYVAAGFSLYITRRVKLEGWDIELAFKRMKNRLDQNNSKNISNPILNLCLPLITSVVIFSLTPTNSFADNYLPITKEKSKTIITKVLEREEFGETITEKDWVYVGIENNKEVDDTSSEWLEKLFGWLFENISNDQVNNGLNIIEIIIWMTVAAVLIWLIRKYAHWLTWINLRPRANKKNKPIPNTILGMDMSKTSLPDDILESFSKLINEKQYREALSLLYRASLSSIVHQGDIEILASATELECCKLVDLQRNRDESSFFKRLTQAWIQLAYAEREPSTETLSSLRDGWIQHYQSNDNKAHP